MTDQIRPAYPPGIEPAPATTHTGELGTEPVHAEQPTDVVEPADVTGLREGERAVTVAPNAWTTAHVDEDRMLVVQAFHANPEPITLAVSDKGEGRFIGDVAAYPPDGWRIREVPFENTSVPSLIAQAQQRRAADAPDQPFVAEKIGDTGAAGLLDVHLLNGGNGGAPRLDDDRETHLASAIEFGLVAQSSGEWDYELTEDGRRHVESLMSLPPGTLG